MAYSTSPYTLVKIEMELMPLASGKTIKWLRPANERQGWASNQGYKVREAMKIALLYPERFPALAKVAEHVTVKILSATEVEARVDIKVPASTVVSEPLAAPVSHQSHYDAPKKEAVTYERIKDTFARLPRGDSVHFDDVQLVTEELDALVTLAGQHDPKYMLLYSSRLKTLTIAPDDLSVPANAKQVVST